jgi:transposase InsO family protein
VFGVSRSAFYKAEEKTGHENLEAALVVGEVRKIRKTQPYPGTEKIYHMIKPFLTEHSIKMGRDKLDKLLNRYGLQSKRRRRRAYQTNSMHRFFKYPNLIKDMVLNRANQLWASDITYIHRFNDFSYLSLITDSYSHRIVGWHLSKDLSTIGPLKALEMALLNRRKDKMHKLPLIHHSDRGIQYCSHAYVNLLKKRNVKISMAMSSYENPVAERINGILKTELLQDGYPTHEEALEAVAEAIRIYNNERPHRSVDMMTPVQAHKMIGPMPKRWRKNGRREKSSRKRRKSQQDPNVKTVELF